jgi:glycopeptide antibiotics resistance protein
MLTGFICSCSIEIVQHITQTGYLQLDDVVTNTMGTLLGWFIWRARCVR